MESGIEAGNTDEPPELFDAFAHPPPIRHIGAVSAQPKCLDIGEDGLDSSPEILYSAASNPCTTQTSL